jgi:hypothetical protein
MNESVTAGALSLRQTATGAPVAGSVVWYGPQAAIFVPSASLNPNTQYAASVGAGAADQNGNQLADPSSWSFTTGSTSSGAGRPRSLAFGALPANPRQAGSKPGLKTSAHRAAHALPPAVRLPAGKLPQLLSSSLIHLEQRLLGFERRLLGRQRTLHRVRTQRHGV